MIEMIENKEYSLMCPCCFKLYPFNFGYNLKFIKDCKDLDYINCKGIEQIDSVHTQPEIVGDCPICKEKVYFITLDRKIASTVSILNIKGYKTLFSCEGDKDMYPYIILDFSHDPNMLCIIKDELKKPVSKLYIRESINATEKSIKLESNRCEYLLNFAMFADSVFKPNSDKNYTFFEDRIYNDNIITKDSE